MHHARKVISGETAKIHAKAIYLPKTIGPSAWQRLLPPFCHSVIMKIPFIDTETIVDHDRPADSQRSPSGSQIPQIPYKRRREESDKDGEDDSEEDDVMEIQPVSHVLGVPARKTAISQKEVLSSQNIRASTSEGFELEMEDV